MSKSDDSKYLIVNAPLISSDVHEYSVELTYLFGLNTITSLPVLTLHTCAVSGCKSCEYNTRTSLCSQCHDGFKLSEDFIK